MRDITHRGSMMWLLLAIPMVFVAHFEASLIGSECETDDDCPWAAFCVDGPRDTLLCQCRDGFLTSSSKQSCLPEIGSECITSLDCGVNAYCASTVDEERTCQCLYDYVSSPSGYGCESNKTLGSACDSTVHCGMNTICIDNQCTCNSGYEPNDDQINCSPYRQLLGAACSSADQCGNGTICVKITDPLPIQSTHGPGCNCKPYFYESANMIDCVADPTKQCTYDYQCPQHSWCGIANKCHCDQHYEDNGNGCQPVSYTTTIIIVVASVAGVVLIAGITLRVWHVRRKKRISAYY